MDSLKILIADDDTLICLGLAATLRHLGHTVVANANNGIRAVELTKQHRPDLCILDIKMPRMDGIEAARIIMAECPTPIIILSGFSDESLIRRASMAGIHTYLVKPVTEDALRPALQLSVERFRKQQEQAQMISMLEKTAKISIQLERAKGIIMEQTRCSEDEAGLVLQQLGHRYNLDAAGIAYIINMNRDFLAGDEMSRSGIITKTHASTT